MAALLLARLLSHGLKAIELNNAPVFCWTDSSVALTWITTHPTRWKEFVHNRVTAIHEMLPVAAWRFVPGKENPADCASRGLTPAQLTHHELWWTGPAWLSKPNTSWPSLGHKPSQDIDLEERPGNAMNVTSRQASYWEILDKISSFMKLLRITTLCQRFILCLRKVPRSAPLNYPLKPIEIENSKKFWLRIVQRTYFRDEIRAISKKEQLPTRWCGLSHSWTRKVY